MPIMYLSPVKFEYFANGRIVQFKIRKKSLAEFYRCVEANVFVATNCRAPINLKNFMSKKEAKKHLPFVLVPNPGFEADGSFDPLTTQVLTYFVNYVRTKIEAQQHLV